MKNKKMFAVEDVSEIFFYKEKEIKYFSYRERKDLTKKSFFQRITEKLFDNLNNETPDFVYQEDYIYCKSSLFCDVQFNTIPKFLKDNPDYLIKDKIVFEKANCVLILTNGNKINLYFETNEEGIEYIDNILAKNKKTFIIIE